MGQKPAGTEAGAAADAGRRRTLLVGVKMDSTGWELLTWSLLKVALPGDSVIALHLLHHHHHDSQFVDPNGNATSTTPFLPLFNSFDSLLSVYQGFCNLKQVDLKLKLCRGASFRKLVIREANSCIATTVILGTARSFHPIRSPFSVAKYCARNMSNNCSVLAVDNGKVVFKRDASIPDFRGIRLLGSSLLAICQSAKNHGLLRKKPVEYSGGVDEGNCAVSSPERSKGPLKRLEHESFSSHDGEEKSLAVVSVEMSAVEDPTCVLPKRKTGWPLLRRWRQGTRDYHRKKTINFAEGENATVAVFDDPPDTTGSASQSFSPNRYVLPKELNGFHEKYLATCRLFKYEELRSSTLNFSSQNLIGRGGNSNVYRGCLPCGKELAVKILKNSDDVLKQFILEIEIITTLHHKNVVSLFGFCFEDNNLLLVYDFLAGGCLEDNLDVNKGSPTFGWCERHKVAVGIAEALDCLHNHTSHPVIHGDVKSSNILLSDEFEPQLSDFGLARWASTSSTHIACSELTGTFGYLAPEYFMYGLMNEKIDVYAFGVVLLELITGRKPINDCPKGQESLVVWAQQFLNKEEKASLLSDPRLGGKYDQEQMEMMMLAADLCVRCTPHLRPKMNTVLKLLQGDGEATSVARQWASSCGGSKRSDHYNMALLDIEDAKQGVSLEDYLQGRCTSSVKIFD